MSFGRDWRRRAQNDSPSSSLAEDRPEYSADEATDLISLKLLKPFRGDRGGRHDGRSEPLAKDKREDEATVGDGKRLPLGRIGGLVDVVIAGTKAKSVSIRVFGVEARADTYDARLVHPAAKPKTVPMKERTEAASASPVPIGVLA